MIGKLPENLLHALLETLPVEFSVVDASDRVVAWNRHDTRIFKRPEGVIGRNVRQCHPPRSLDKVEAILEEMKSGGREQATFWIDLSLDEDGNKQKILIQYFALRDAQGTYLGCLECTQNITPMSLLQGEKRLLD